MTLKQKKSVQWKIFADSSLDFRLFFFTTPFSTPENTAHLLVNKPLLLPSQNEKVEGKKDEERTQEEERNLPTGRSMD